jgi:hypothetical protein
MAAVTLKVNHYPIAQEAILKHLREANAIYNLNAYIAKTDPSLPDPANHSPKMLEIRAKKSILDPFTNRTIRTIKKVIEGLGLTPAYETDRENRKFIAYIYKDQDIELLAAQGKEMDAPSHPLSTDAASSTLPLEPPETADTFKRPQLEKLANAAVIIKDSDGFVCPLTSIAATLCVLCQIYSIDSIPKLQSEVTALILPCVQEASNGNLLIQIPLELCSRQTSLFNKLQDLKMFSITQRAINIPKFEHIYVQELEIPQNEIVQFLEDTRLNTYISYP